MNNIDDAIKNELILFYQKQFGSKWTMNLHKNLLPSTYRFLAVYYKVPIDYIYSIHYQLANQFRDSASLNASY